MRSWEGHGFGVGKIVSCMHFGFEDPFAPIYGGGLWSGSHSHGHDRSLER